MACVLDSSGLVAQAVPPGGQKVEELEPFLDLCVSSLREGHANLGCRTTMQHVTVNSHCPVTVQDDNEVTVQRFRQTITALFMQHDKH